MSRDRPTLDIFWTRSAERDLDRSSQYYRSVNPKTSRRVIAQILKAVRTLGQHPELGKPAELESEREYRELVVHHFRVFYRIEKHRIIVARIWDTRQNPEEFFVGG